MKTAGSWQRSGGRARETRALVAAHRMASAQGNRERKSARSLKVIGDPLRRLRAAPRSPEQSTAEARRCGERPARRSCHARRQSQSQNRQAPRQHRPQRGRKSQRAAKGPVDSALCKRWHRIGPADTQVSKRLPLEKPQKAAPSYRPTSAPRSCQHGMLRPQARLRDPTHHRLEKGFRWHGHHRSPQPS